MPQEIIRNPEQAEQELTRIIERYRSESFSELSVYAYYGVENDMHQEILERERQQALFLSGEQENPILNYPRLQNDQTQDFLNTSEHDILDLMKDAIALEYNSDRETALYDILRLKLLQISLLQTTATFANMRDMAPEQRKELVESFNVANDEVYDTLEPAYFFGIVEYVQNNAQTILADESVPPAIKEAGRYLATHMLSRPEGQEVRLPTKASNEKIVVLQDVIKEIYTDLINCIPEKPEGEVFTNEELVEIFRRAHEVRNTGWSVRLVEGKKNVDTRQEEKSSVVGARRTQATKLGATKILLHENGVHVERRQRGDASGDALFGGTGLAGYDTAEEGLATIVEQILEGRQRKSGEQYYFTIGAAKGVDGTPRNFRGVFELEWRRRILDKYIETNKEPTEADTTKQREAAYNTCERIFRGTFCDEPGMVYTKDLAYFNGNQKMWQVMMEIADMPREQRRAAFERLLVAKYDPTNELHQRLIDSHLNKTAA